ncbi:phage integrase central domain-containing protein [Sphingobium yanoikuyae]|jgi:hypothetical protein|uniref:phage integrase central domain-containing protein n=1 Tax=Sphingobium yanoikuyae TaxID=13690 RepID=UPI003AF46C3A
MDPGPKAPSPVTSFEAAVRAWHGNRATGLEPRHAARILSCLEHNVFPSLGQRDLKDISAGDVLTMLRAVEARGKASGPAYGAGWGRGVAGTGSGDRRL